MRKPTRVAQLCVVGFVFIGVGCGAMAAFSKNFACICVSTIFRSIGSSLVWTDSTLLIQKFTPTHLLGRVNSIDTTGALLGESISNIGGGLLMDRLNVTPEELSWILSGIGFSFVLIWSPLCFKSPNKEQQL